MGIWKSFIVGKSSNSALSVDDFWYLIFPYFELEFVTLDDKKST